jgi:NAD(P)-dependent dehydrogenase (short-subunit alcohol dehydrogenase family)
MKKEKVWFVTGASKGLGLALVKHLLKEGYKVAATSRDVNALRAEAGHESEYFLPLEVSLTSDGSVSEAVAGIIAKLGTIDVVVNNAGYGQLGTLEELTDEEARENFNVNVFGTLNVIRHVMPHFREKKSGAFFNISSRLGHLQRHQVCRSRSYRSTFRRSQIPGRNRDHCVSWVFQNQFFIAGFTPYRDKPYCGIQRSTGSGDHTQRPDHRQSARRS